MCGVLRIVFHTLVFILALRQVSFIQTSSVWLKIIIIIIIIIIIVIQLYIQKQIKFPLLLVLLLLLLYQGNI